MIHKATLCHSIICKYKLFAEITNFDHLQEQADEVLRVATQLQESASVNWLHDEHVPEK